MDLVASYYNLFVLIQAYFTECAEAKNLQKALHPPAGGLAVFCLVAKIKSSNR
jgi:cytochrome b